jgi:hypothetical protein
MKYLKLYEEYMPLNLWTKNKFLETQKKINFKDKEYYIFYKTTGDYWALWIKNNDEIIYHNFKFDYCQGFYENEIKRIQEKIDNEVPDILSKL